MHSGRAFSRVALLPVWIIVFVIQLPAQSPPSAPQGSTETRQSSPTSSPVDSVEVINGSTRRTQVFGEEEPQPTQRNRSARAKTAKKEQETAPSVPEVDIINGARWETRRFVDAEDEITTPWFERRTTRPVVVDVESVDTESRRGNPAQMGSTARVVVGIASSESKGKGGNTKPIQYRIAPDQPKRPPYYPGPPGSQ